MVDPLIALFYGLVITGLVTLFLWRGRTYLNRVARGKELSERIYIEDALKHLFDRKYHNTSASIESISGSLNINRNKAARLLVKLETLKLIQTQNNNFQLTQAGISYALQIIRIHRLWELYFADKTGFTEVEWHLRAEEQEHFTSKDQAEMLALQMGNPSYDPHGDPIPTIKGEIPPKSGMSLADLSINNFAQIIHLEDEPDEIFSELIGAGLHPGMKIQVVNRSPENITLSANRQKIQISPIAAANVTVADLTQKEEYQETDDRLTNLAIGESGVVTQISRACRGLQRQRIMDLGVIPGTRITAEMRSAGGDPVAYDIRGALIAIRSEQANYIHIRKLENTNDGRK